jgi:hypothetical protein
VHSPPRPLVQFCHRAGTELFVGFVFLSFNNSLAGEFMEEARSLVADAPPGKVWDCIPPHNAPTDDGFPPVPVVKPGCERVLVDADTWQRSTDSLIRQVYLCWLFWARSYVVL